MTVGELIQRTVPRVAPSSFLRPAAARPTFTLLVTAAMPLVLLASWIAADALQPHRYSPVRQTISVAAGHAGADRWVMTTGLLAIGLGYLATAVLAEPDLGFIGSLGLAWVGICGLGVALFPEAAHGPTTGHEFWSVLGAVALMTQPVFTYRRGVARRGPPGRPVTVAASVVFVGLTVWLGCELHLGEMTGAAERVTTTLEVGWPLVVTRCRRRCPSR